MAHRVAELIDRGNANEKDRKEATDLILKCWDRRRVWTSGWPPKGLGDVFGWIERDLQIQSDHGWPEDPWTRRLTQVRRSLNEELRLWARLAVAEERPTVSALEESDLINDEFDDGERRAAELLRRLVASAESTFGDLGEHATSQDRVELLRTRIAELQAGRAALLDDMAVSDGEPAATTKQKNTRRQTPSKAKAKVPPKARGKPKADPTEPSAPSRRKRHMPGR